jgi:hypothetical protein
LAGKSQKSDLGVPAGLQLFSCFPFAGLNLSAARTSIKDQEFADIENFVKVGDGNLRTLWDAGSPIYTTSGGLSIINYFFFNIAKTQYVAVFLNDGTAVQVEIDNATETVMSSTPSTFYVHGNLPGCIQWGSQYLLIGNNHTQNAYWVWDGAILYGSGTLAPDVTITNNGSGYTSAPTVTAFGGSGSGATFEAIVQTGQVTAIYVTDPGTGYQVGDMVQLAISGGGSTGSSAELTAVLTPNGLGQILITNGGSGYTSGPTVTITGGGGSGATAGVVLTNGVITQVTVVNSGTGYTSAPTIGFSGGGGSGATAIGVVSSTVYQINVVSGGSGFFGAPTLTIAGGGGYGAQAEVSGIVGGVITSVRVLYGGTGYTSVPSVLVEPLTNYGAAATVSLMPYGVSGTCIEDYVSRVWIGNPHTPASNPAAQNNGNKFLVSAPGSLSDFATSDGGLIYTSQDRFLRAKYVAMRQTNGYLYPIGDSSVSIISGVNTSGNPATTTFNYQNTDPQIGTPWRDSCQDFGRVVLLSNALGVYGIYGGAVNKISDAIDPIFSNTYPNNIPIAGTITPTTAVANIFGKKYFIQLMTVVDPITLATENKMLIWDSKDWFLGSQSVALTMIATQEVNSNLTAWGSDGTAIYPLFQTPSATLTKRLSTKLWGVNRAFISKQAYGVIMQGQNQQTPGGAVDLTISIDTEAGTYPVGQTSFSLSSAYPTGYPLVNNALDAPAGLFLGLTLTTNDADITLNYLGLGYTEISYELSSIGLQLSEVDSEPV